MNSKTEKLSYEELIKALQCCANTIETNMCGECPAAKYKAGKCDDLVKLQAAEMLKDLKAENEKLQAKCEDCAGCTQWNCDCANERAEAVAKFVEILKENSQYIIGYGIGISTNKIAYLSQRMLNDNSGNAQISDNKNLSFDANTQNRLLKTFNGGDGI